MFSGSLCMNRDHRRRHLRSFGDGGASSVAQSHTLLLNGTKQTEHETERNDSRSPVA